MNVLFLTKYTSTGPSSRYRVFQFIPYLESRGICCDVQSLHDDDYLPRRFRGEKVSIGYLVGRFAARLRRLLDARRYDVTFIQKELFPHLPGVIESVLSASGTKLVLDIDDAIFLLYERSGSPIARTVLGRKIPRVMSKCALVLAGNRYLADYARQFTRNVALFPTVVDATRFTPAAAPPATPVVGWMGSPATVSYLHDLAPALEEAAAAHPFELFVVGSDWPATLRPLARAKPWRETEEADDLRRMTVGVMPLPDDLWSRGKCSLKLLQYMSAGLAAVSSPRGSASEIISHGENGFLADSPAEWQSALEQLLGDGAEAARVGAAARRWVEQNYCLENYAPRLAEHLVSVAREVPVG